MELEAQLDARRASVIIPNLDSSVVDRAVAAIQTQDGGPPGEILVVGRDGPGRMAFCPDARLISTDGAVLPGEARNIGASAAGGDVLVFLDADCVPAPGWLRAHLARQAAGETVVGGAVRYDDAPFWRLVDNLASFHESDPDSPAGPRRYLPTLNLSVAVATYKRVGPMDSEFPRGEDLDWTIRAAAAGARPYFEPTAVVWHRPTGRDTATSVLGRWRESGRWMVRVRARHPAAFGAPPTLYAPVLLALLSPLLAAAATARIFRAGPGRRHPRALAAVYLTKLAWCWGAARPVAAT